MIGPARRRRTPVYARRRGIPVGGFFPRPPARVLMSPPRGSSVFGSFFFELGTLDTVRSRDDLSPVSSG